MEAIGIGVAIAVISAAIIAASRSALRNREAIKQRVRERRCRHEWEPMPRNVITGDLEWCVKCGARR